VFLLTGADAAVDCNVSTDFLSAGAVHVDRGVLRLQGPLDNLQGGVLTDGRWIVQTDGRLEFPGPITEVSGCDVLVEGNGQIPDLASLELLSGASRLRTDGNHSFNGPFTIAEGSSLNVAGYSTLATGGPLEVGEPDDSVVSELSGIVVLAKAAGGQAPKRTGPPVITTPLLDNGYGRVLPTERSSVGALQLVGDYIQGPDAYLHIDVSAAGADVLDIDGDATLDGSLELNRLDPVTPGTQFTVLTTTGVVSGAFAEIIAPDVYSVSYQSNSVTVTFEQNLTNIFADGFESGNTAAWALTMP
jgi:hypothetical protein